MTSPEPIDSVLKRAEEIRYNSKTSCVQLENYLFYQKTKLNSGQRGIMLCGSCASDKAVVKPAFKRAFKSLTNEEQANFYLKNCQFVADFMNGRNEAELALSKIRSGTNRVSSPSKN